MKLPMRLPVRLPLSLPVRVPLHLLTPGTGKEAPVPIVDCDREMECEREQWLHRRFMVFCALWAFVSFCFTFPILLSFTGPSVTPGTLALWDLACTLPGLLIPLGALWYVWQRSVSR